MPHEQQPQQLRDLLARLYFQTLRAHENMLPCTSYSPGTTAPARRRARSDAAVPLQPNDALVGFLDLPKRQGPCLISDFSQSLPCRHKIVKSSLWGATSEDKPCLLYIVLCIYVHIYICVYTYVYLIHFIRLTQVYCTLLDFSAREARLKNLAVPLLCFMRRLLSHHSNFLRSL